ncbi:MAG: hypothetical protein ACLSHO_05700 [Dysosmobacter sp.]
MLYFTGIFIAVHLEAKKLGLKGMPRVRDASVGERWPNDAICIAPLVLLVCAGLLRQHAPCSSPQPCPFWPPSWWAF